MSYPFAPQTKLYASEEAGPVKAATDSSGPDANARHFDFLSRSSSIRSFGATQCNSPDDFDSEAPSDEDEVEDSELPPPQAFIARSDRGSQCRIAPTSTLSRARSSSPRKTNEPGEASSGRKGMTRVKSMPNLQHDRSAYNRSVGRSILASVSEFGGGRASGVVRSRAEELDALLDGLE